MFDIVVDEVGSFTVVSGFSDGGSSGEGGGKHNTFRLCWYFPYLDEKYLQQIFYYSW